MENKEKALLWVALIFGAALFVGAIVEGVRHSGKHGTTYPTRTEFNAFQRKWESDINRINKRLDSLSCRGDFYHYPAQNSK